MNSMTSYEYYVRTCCRTSHTHTLLLYNTFTHTEAETLRLPHNKETYYAWRGSGRTVTASNYTTFEVVLAADTGTRTQAERNTVTFEHFGGFDIPGWLWLRGKRPHEKSQLAATLNARGTRHGAGTVSGLKLSTKCTHKIC